MPKVSSDVVIVGAGETRVGKLPGLHSLQIQAWAVEVALCDCGLTTKHLDGLLNLDPYSVPHSMFATTLAEYLGVRTKYHATVDVGGTVSIMAMLQQAIFAIQAGHCEIMACVYGENALSGRSKNATGLEMLNLHGDEEWEEPFGLHGMVTPYALLAQRYLHDYGATPLDFAEVAVLTRRHALNNDNAQMTKPISLEDHQQSRPISSPLRLLDCSLVSDGGGALVLMSRDRARHLGLPYVSVTSLAMRATHGSIMQAPDIAGLAVSEAANDAFDAAGHGPEDMQVALVHDAFTVSVLLSLEALGFCGPGQAGAYIRSGKAAMGGSCTLNPHGGLLSQGHIGGMLHVTEAVHQLKGTAGRRQVENVRRAVVSGNGGVFSVCGVMVMEAA